MQFYRRKIYYARSWWLYTELLRTIHIFQNPTKWQHTKMDIQLTEKKIYMLSSFNCTTNCRLHVQRQIKCSELKQLIFYQCLIAVDHSKMFQAQNEFSVTFLVTQFNFSVDAFTILHIISFNSA